MNLAIHFDSKATFYPPPPNLKFVYRKCRHQTNYKSSLYTRMSYLAESTILGEL